MPAVVDQLPDLETDIAVFVGGLDEETPTLSLKPGRAVARFAVNYEAVATPGGGYARIGGYERYDGRARPSDATYAIIQVVSFTNVPTSGQTLTGGTSGATATVIATGSNYIVVTQITGTFTTSEALTVGATPIGTATPQTVTISSKLNAQYLNLAADVYRALIGAVPGSGAVYPVALSNSGVLNVFAFRGTGLYKASGSGWTAVTLYNEVSFTVGTGTEPADGTTLTQGANTATIKRTVTESGSWAGGTAAGRFIVTTPAPGNFAAGAATAPGATFTLSGVQTAITITAGGRYEFVVRNFGGRTTTRRIYGCDSINRGFEFDGEVYVPLKTNTTPDTPKHVQVHLQHLMFAIGSSVVSSGPGLPYRFNGTDGGAEIACGDDVTGLIVLPGISGNATLLIDRRNSKGILYGSASAGDDKWRLLDFNADNAAGGLHYSQQVLTDALSLDDAGIISLRAAQELSGFSPATLTYHIQKFITSKRGLLTCSSVHRTKSQYRLFFSDGSGLWTTLVNGKVVGAMPILYSNALAGVWNCETASGEELTFAGAASGGYVYQLDRGSSFDGGNIDALLVLAWDHKKSPRTVKSYRRASIEITSNYYASIGFAHRVGYGQAKYAQPGQQSYETNFSGVPNWDSISWDAFTWDGNTLSPTEVKMTGDGENVEVTLSSTTDIIYPYTLNSVVTHFFRRRSLR